MNRAKLRSIAMSGFYTDGIDHSNLDPNLTSRKDSPLIDGCVNCGEMVNVTVTNDKDICHECGYVYD
jgi:hypothetical protein